MPTKNDEKTPNLDLASKQPSPASTDDFSDEEFDGGEPSNQGYQNLQEGPERPMAVGTSGQSFFGRLYNLFSYKTLSQHPPDQDAKESLTAPKKGK